MCDIISKFGAKSETAIIVGVRSAYVSGCGLSIIDCLSAGYRFLGWRIELLLIPLLLDVMLWLGPRFSIMPIFSALADTYTATAGMENVTPDMSLLLDQFAASIREMGETANLADGLISGAILHVPSLGPVGAPANATVLIVSNPMVALLLWISFGLIGVLLGVVYLGLLARRLPIGGMAHVNLGGFVGATLWHWLRTVGFIALVFVLLLMIYIPIAFAISILMFINPSLGTAAVASAGALSLVLFFYLYFVTAGIVMDNLGIWPAMVRSVQLVRRNFWATLGFVMLSTLIGLGFALLLAQLAQSAAWLHLVAILANAYIGTGLALALLVFYRSRLLKEQEA